VSSTQCCNSSSKRPREELVVPVGAGAFQDFDKEDKFVFDEDEAEDEQEAEDSSDQQVADDAEEEELAEDDEIADL
jgi:hypothetical protein